MLERNLARNNRPVNWNFGTTLPLIAPAKIIHWLSMRYPADSFVEITFMYFPILIFNAWFP